MKKYLAVIGSVIVVLVLVFIFSRRAPINNTYGGVTIGNEYQSTTTSSSVGVFNFLNSDTNLCVGNGTLGTVNITGAVGTGNIVIYDASSSLPWKRTVAATTSLRTLASFPASTAANSFVYDSVAFDGILVDVNGLIGTTTITYRCN